MELVSFYRVIKLWSFFENLFTKTFCCWERHFRNNL